jgi:hypothetical protein
MMMTRKSVEGVLILLCVQCWEASCTAVEQDDYTIHDDGIDSQDKFLLFAIFALFGVIVSVCGSLLAYVSFVEDKIMQEYRNHGVRVVGDVVATKFTRGVGNKKETMVRFENQREYFVNVQYTMLISATYPIRIRKQIRCLEDDFWYPDQPEVNVTSARVSQNHTICQDPCFTSKSDMEQGIFEITTCSPQQSPKAIEIVTSTDSFIKEFQLCHEKKLQLLVLPCYPMSALTVPQVERRLGARHRLYSILFFVAAVTIAMMCFHLAAQFLLGTNTNTSESALMVSSSFLPNERNILLLHSLFLVVALLPIPCVHCSFNGAIRNYLQEEYFESGDIFKGGVDEDSSLSTWNTDSIAGST